MTDELEIQEAARRKKLVELESKPAGPVVMLPVSTLYDAPAIREHAAAVVAPPAPRKCGAQGGPVSPCTAGANNANKCSHSRWGDDPCWEGPCGCSCHELLKSG